MAQAGLSTAASSGAPPTELARQLRLMNAQAVLFSQAVAERLGMNSTELESMDFFHLYGPMTAGRLADLTGLSTGGVTRLIDRLERKGCVRREADPADRRRVIVHLLEPPSGDRIGPLFQSCDREMRLLMATYDAQSLATVLDFVTRSNVVMHEEITRLREVDVDPVPSAAGGAE